ncbi:unnamed protein product [Choristocarpus tenellus]
MLGLAPVKMSAYQTSKSTFLCPTRSLHLQWRCTICPLRASVIQAQARWIERVESVRKDFECFFSRVKSRFGILNLPLLYSHRKKIDTIFFTCSILQNMLYSYDGLGELEGNTDWTRDAGLHDAFCSGP